MPRPSPRARALALAALALVSLIGCTPDPITGAESWRSTPEIRIALLATPDRVRIQALDATQPIEAQLDGADGAELWILAYRADTLRAAFPGLADATIPEILGRLAPQLGTSGGEVPPQADDVLSARVGDGAPNPLEYAHPTWADWRSRAPSGLEFRFQLSEADYCGAATLTTVATSTSVVFDGVVAVGDGRAVVTGSIRGGADRLVRALVYDPAEGGLRALPTLTTRGPVSGRLSWDPPARTVWGVSNGAAFRFGLDGAEAPAPPPPALPGVLTNVAALSVGRDGTAMATFPMRAVENGEDIVAPALFRLESGEWRVQQSPNVGYRQIDVVRRERVIVWFRCWVHQFRDPVAIGGWRQSVLDARCPSMQIIDTVAIDLDDEGGVVVGNLGFVHVRDEARNEWFDASAGLPREDYVVAAAMGGGRVLVGSGTSGKLYFRSGVHWCPVPVPSGVTYDLVASVPEGGAAFLVPAVSRDALVMLTLP